MIYIKTLAKCFAGTIIYIKDIKEKTKLWYLGGTLNSYKITLKNQYSKCALNITVTQAERHNGIKKLFCGFVIFSAVSSLKFDQ